MATGELNFNDIIMSGHLFSKIFKYITFVCFVVIIGMVLVSLLTGMAVRDVEGLNDIAKKILKSSKPQKINYLIPSYINFGYLQFDFLPAH
mgnify:CR=1 FL=1